MVDRRSSDPNGALLRDCAILGSLFFFLTAAAYIAMLSVVSPIPRDASSLVVGRDFLNFWMYGRAAFMAEPRRWYDVAVYQHALAVLLGAGYPGQNWSYPPSIMLLAAPFGLMGYLWALLVWTAAGLAVFVAVVRRYSSAPLFLLAALASPAAVFCLISGQSSLVTTAILLGAFALLDRRPVVAGLLIGLLTLKPQIGLMLPIVLIASARWRVFCVATATALAIAGLSAALFGWQSWVAFVTQGIPTQNLVLIDAAGIAAPFYPTIYMNLHGAGASYPLAMAVQVVGALAAASAVAWAFRFRRNADPRMLFALFAAATVAALPYLLIYDTLPLTVAALLLLRGNGLESRGRLLMRLVYWLPLLQIGFGQLHLPGPALIAPIFALYVLSRLRRDDIPAAGTFL